MMSLHYYDGLVVLEIRHKVDFPLQFIFVELDRLLINEKLAKVSQRSHVLPYNKAFFECAGKLLFLQLLEEVLVKDFKESAPEPVVLSRHFL